MRLRTILPALLLASLVSTLLAAGDATAGSEEQDLVRKEKLRAEVASVFADLYAPPARDPAQAPLFTWITERLIAIGPGIEPMMVAELESPNRFTFNVAAYMLGFFPTPRGKEAILKAAEIAERDGGAFGLDRKVWLSYALALTGDPDALDVLDTGKVNGVRKEFVERMSVLEVVAVLTGARGVPKLLLKLDRYGKSDDATLRERLPVILHALGRVGDPSLRDRIVPYLENGDPNVRDAAARALAAPADVSVADRLFAALDDGSNFSRFGVASALEQLKPPGKGRAIGARLETEEDTAVRGALYRTLAGTEGEAAIEKLAGYWGHPDALDRMFLVDAVGKLKSRKGMNMLRLALQDPDNRVVLHAIGALADSGSPAAADTLLTLIQDLRWPVEEQTLLALSGSGEARAAARIADRLRPMLLAPLAALEERDQLMIRADALVDLRFPAILPDVRKAIEIQPDPTVTEYLRGLARRLAALEERKDDAARWVEALSSPDLDVRKLAYRRLGDLKAQAAVKPLVEAFGRVDVSEGTEILFSLGKIGAPDAVPLLERVLLEPAFDAQERAPLRSMAAWAASRGGGVRMADLLKRSAERREGRDIDVLVYLAVLTGKEAVLLLEHQRGPRLRWFDWHRGPELERLDWILRELKAGRSIESLNRPPHEIALS